jgi:DNA-directed RNA polymerase specialized sigma subunit
MENDKEQLLEWQKTKSPELFAALYGRFQPLVNSVVNKYRTTGLAPSTLRTQANVQLIKAMETFNGNKGTQPITHVYNSLNKVQRLANESLISGHIPEQRSMKRSLFTITKENLGDELGREANNSEMADSLHWSIGEVERMNKELRGETTASSAPFDFYGNSNTSESKDKILLDYLYNELSGPKKLVFEYSLGYGGKPILSNKEIGKKMNLGEMAIHRMKRSMAEQIKDYR